jgi:hypothetical protein
MVTFMCYAVMLRPQPSGVPPRWQDRHVHTLSARIVPPRNELLCILAGERILVVPPFEWAHDGCVPVFNIKAAMETHIPVVVDLIYVGEIWVPVLLLLHTCGGLCDAATIRNHCSDRLGSSCSTHSICKRCMAVTTTAPTAAATAPRPLSPTLAGVSSNGREKLLHRDSDLPDGRHMKLFARGKGLRVLFLGRDD